MLVEGDDDLIGADQAKILAHQLIRYVRIGLLRVEQVGTVLERGMVPFNLRQLGLSLLQSTVIAAPGKDPVGAGNRMASEGTDDDHRQGRHRHPADQPENAVRTSHHDVKRITPHPRTQVKRMIWWTK